MKVIIHENYHDGVRMLPEGEQDAFYGALVRYVIDGREPELNGASAAIWNVIKPFVDKSVQSQRDGAKGGDGRGNTRAKKVENPKADGVFEKVKTPSKKKAKRVPISDIKTERGIESLKGFYTHSHAGARVEDAPRCEKCGAELESSAVKSGGAYTRVRRCPNCDAKVAAS